MNRSAIISIFEDTNWKDFPGAPEIKYFDVEGSITEPGPFIARVKLPAGLEATPHSHLAPFAERNTVISGVLYVGVGETFDRASCVPLKPGGVVVFPPGLSHFTWNEHETIVQVHGEGPWISTATK
ncbi:cupin domain-containing protein [Pseudomonas hefeiensis]|uniref:Cupin domain-containing protein n=1 Tax=Pseudomonas hefeiensis TaxID=2738125 RepID=A0ABY9GI01_9PSED|nr:MULTISPECIES: cupin domain-containing protein [unclassified Pseudomonas]WLH15121.1 cupin domain-containing protein [Pseudomonas sp. FP205]WLH98168.1 cupin domain-containing protein [Pseudomonas sp. FP53]WLI42444.1 cupin domain-containing protein [Pseudomonas sp. FP821]